LDGIAHARGAQMGTLVEARLGRFEADTTHLLRVAAAWLGREGLALDHRSLNLRFIPILEQYPEYAEVWVTGPSGSEWMLRRRPDGTWLNRLSGSQEQDDTRRFLEWSNPETLIKDERRPSNYAPLRQPWMKKALATPPGQITWSEIHLLPDSNQPGITATLRLPPAGGQGLLLGMDLRLADLAHYLNSIGLGHKGFVVLLSIQGRLLGLSNLNGGSDYALRDNLVFQPVLSLDLGPLRQGLDFWLGRGVEPLIEQLILHDLDLWHVGFHKLALGGEGLWLGVFLPLSEVLPGLYLRLAILGALLLAVWSGALLMGRRLGRTFSVPLEALVVRSHRIARLDFATLPQIHSHIREIRHLALSQDQMRNALSTIYRDLQLRRNYSAPSPP